MLRQNDILLLGLMLITGCHVLSSDSIKNPKQPAVEEQSVEVSGSVSQAGVVNIPVSGITLQQAILRAGGIRHTTGEKPDELFVALQRRKGLGGDIHYFPLLLVESDIFGLIQLRSGDSVRVVNLANTTWKLPQGGTSRPFFVEGLVEKPGIKKTDSDPLFPLNRFDQLAQVKGTGEQKIGNEVATIMVVTRTATHGVMLEHYCIPTLPSAANNGPLTESIKKWLAADIAANDQLLFTQATRLPILLASLAENKLREIRTTLNDQRRRLAEAEQQLPWLIRGYRSLQSATMKSLECLAY